MKKCLGQEVMVMYQDKRFLAIIPARGGSKGVPRKNIRDLAGKPLIAWTIAEAEKSKYLDRCIVSTEDEEIRKVSETYGGDVPFLRPMELAQDQTAGIDVAMDAIHRLPGYDYVVLLQPTSPLRTVEDIDDAIALCIDRGAKSCVGVTEAEHSPYWMYSMNAQQVMRPLLEISEDEIYQRQKLPKAYQLNGAVYVNEIEDLSKHRDFVCNDTLGYIMPQERSYDIDTLQDFRIAEILMKERLGF